MTAVTFAVVWVLLALLGRFLAELMLVLYLLGRTSIRMLMARAGPIDLSTRHFYPGAVAASGGVYKEPHVTTTTQRSALRPGAHDTRGTTRSRF